MRIRALLLFLLLLAASLGFSSAMAAVPDPANSTTDGCLRVCPHGDLFPFHVTVRDVANVPIANSTVVISFCNCPGVHLCSTASCQVSALTDASGNASFQIQAGGTGSGATVSADGVLLATMTVASPDQDGDLTVTAADVAIVTGKIGSILDYTADFDCDGTVSAVDLAVTRAHLGHNCQGVVPTEPKSWGNLKAIYR